MKTTNFIWACLVVLGMSLGNTSCSNDDEPNVEPEENVLIETPLPADAEPGKVYALRHDKKNGKCVFQFYFGKTRSEELGSAYIGATAILQACDINGNIIDECRLQAPDTPKEHLSSDQMDTFTISTYICEKIRTFKISVYDGSDSFNDPVEYTQQYRSPHVFSN